MRKTLYRGVEQLVARQAHNLEVVRSSRASATQAKASIILIGAFLFSPYPPSFPPLTATSFFHLQKKRLKQEKQTLRTLQKSAQNGKKVQKTSHFSPKF